MDNIETLFIELICCEISNIKPNIKSMDRETLLSLYKVAKAHDLAHFIAKVFFDNDFNVEDDIKSLYQKELMMAIYRHEKMNYELIQISSVLEKEGIDFIPLKGSIIKNYYKEPYMRTSCDIDILVKENDIEKATKLLKEKYDYTVGDKNFYDVSIFSKSGVHIELHFNLSEKSQKIDEVLSKVWETAYLQDDKKHTYMMSNEMIIIYSIIHIAKHFEYGGYGVRPFIDLYILQDKMKYDNNKVVSTLERCQLLKFYNSCIELIDVWFKNQKSTELTISMQKFIINSGSYGTLENRVAIGQSKNGGKFAYWLKRVFPSFDYLKTYYSRLSKYPFLYPYYLIKRWIRILFTNRKKAVAELKSNANLSDKKAKEIANLMLDIGLK